MHYSTSTYFSITLLDFLSSLAFNNRIDNLTLITKFREPLFSGGGAEAVPLLPAGRAGPGSGTKFGSLAKFIWFLLFVFCVIHYGSGRSAFCTLYISQIKTITIYLWCFRRNFTNFKKFVVKFLGFAPNPLYLLILALYSILKSRKSLFNVF